MKYFVMIVYCLLCGISSSTFSQEAKPARQLAQPVLMALPKATPTKDPITLYNEDKNIQAAYTAICKVLADRKLEYRDLLKVVANVDKLRAKIPSFNSDPNAFIAAGAGADIYLEYSVELITDGPFTKVRIILDVKEAATAKGLGSGSGTSKPMATKDVSSLTEIALNNCIESVMQQIRGYWSEMPKNGKPIMVTVSSADIDLNQPTSNGKRIDRDLAKLIKENTIQYRRELSTAKNMVFNPVYLDIYKYDDLTDFSNLIEDLFGTFGVKFNTEIEGKSIEITVKQ